MPCLTRRLNTERAITIRRGTNHLVSMAGLSDAVVDVLVCPPQLVREPPHVWAGRIGERIARILHD